MYVGYHRFAVGLAFAHEGHVVHLVVGVDLLDGLRGRFPQLAHGEVIDVLDFGGLIGRDRA